VNRESHEPFTASKKYLPSNRNTALCDTLVSSQAKPPIHQAPAHAHAQISLPNKTMGKDKDLDPLSLTRFTSASASKTDNEVAAVFNRQEQGQGQGRLRSGHSLRRGTSNESALPSTVLSSYASLPLPTNTTNNSNSSNELIPFISHANPSSRVPSTYHTVISDDSCTTNENVNVDSNSHSNSQSPSSSIAEETRSNN
jgi:hypothetical protein